jgi:hypothetical protein
VVDVIDPFDLRMGLDRHRVEAAHLPYGDKGRLQLTQRLHRRGRPHVFVFGQDSEAVDILHRDHRILEAAFFPGLCGALLALHCVGVHVISREAVFGCD